MVAGGLAKALTLLSWFLLPSCLTEKSQYHSRCFQAFLIPGPGPSAPGSPSGCCLNVRPRRPTAAASPQVPYPGQPAPGRTHLRPQTGSLHLPSGSANWRLQPVRQRASSCLSPTSCSWPRLRPRPRPRSRPVPSIAS